MPHDECPHCGVGLYWELQHKWEYGYPETFEMECKYCHKKFTVEDVDMIPRFWCPIIEEKNDVR